MINCTISGRVVKIGSKEIGHVLDNKYENVQFTLENALTVDEDIYLKTQSPVDKIPLSLDIGRSIATWEVTSVSLQNSGILECQLQIENNNGVVWNSRIFEFVVRDSIAAETQLEQENPTAFKVLQTQVDTIEQNFDDNVSANTDVSANTGLRHTAVTITNSDTADLTLNGQDIKIDVKKQGSIISDSNGLKLNGDVSNPGNIRYYGTNETGTKGFHLLPSIDTIELTTELRMQNEYEGVRVEYDWLEGLPTQQRHYDANNNLVKQIDYTWNNSDLESAVYTLNEYDVNNQLGNTIAKTVTYTWLNGIVTEVNVS